MAASTRTWWKTALGLLFTAMMLFPLYWMINVSLTDRSSIRRGDLYPQAFTFEHYRVVLGDQLPHLGTSVLVGIGTVALTLVIAAPAGYALSKLLRRGRGTIGFLLIVAQMIPAVVIALGFYSVYTDLGVLNTIPGLILADSTIAVPFGVMLFAAFMSGIPRELTEAAQIDGASYPRTFLTVILPISRNAAATVGLFAFLWS